MTEAEDFHWEEKLVRELLIKNLWRRNESRWCVLEAAKKNLNETEGRFGETKTLLDDEQNKGKKYTVI